MAEGTPETAETLDGKLGRAHRSLGHHVSFMVTGYRETFGLFPIENTGLFETSLTRMSVPGHIDRKWTP
ncbi:hypothetical protein GCM10023157_34180 [Gluconacetobacter asukensis]